MTNTDELSLELKMAKAAYAAAEEMKKAAEQDLEAGRYERGQAERSLREIQVLEKSIAAREQKLRELDEAKLVAREHAADAKLEEARSLLSQYSADRHGAARALIAINEREQAERSAA